MSSRIVVIGLFITVLFLSSTNAFALNECSACKKDHKTICKDECGLKDGTDQKECKRTCLDSKCSVCSSEASAGKKAKKKQKKAKKKKKGKNAKVSKCQKCKKFHGEGAELGCSHGATDCQAGECAEICSVKEAA